MSAHFDRAKGKWIIPVIHHAKSGEQMTPTIPSRLAEARQLLNACGWSVSEQVSNQYNKTTYVVFDSAGTPRRSFVPIQRLLDYARGVFDAQDWA